MEDILWLDGIREGDAPAVGGKGLHLSELKGAGFNVPDGFVVTTDVYGKTVSSLSKNIEAILSSLDVQKTDELERAAAKIQSLITAAGIPEESERRILDAYRRLTGSVAVRSSGIAEDTQAASFAGQMDTFLDVQENSLLGAVKKCMASLFTARAIYYRAQKNIGYRETRIAIVVQNMVSAAKAGVAFSANPVTRNAKEIVVEAAKGMGESVVAGKVIPDNYVIDKETGTVKESRVAPFRTLSNRELGEIISAVKKIENYYGSPQDVEWAIDNEGRLFILQARPITTLFVKPKPTWKKIISREYGVQYTELSIKCLSDVNKDIVPAPFSEQAYIPDGNNEACYTSESAWNSFVSALKEKYFTNPKNYDEFEESFIHTGQDYVNAAKKISQTKLNEKSGNELKVLYSEYSRKNIVYGSYIWMQFLINTFYAESAKEIITRKFGKDNPKLFDYIEIALKPVRKAASVQLAEMAAKWNVISTEEKESVYENFKWIPCMDIHNLPWAREEFFSHVGEFVKSGKKESVTYEAFLKDMNAMQGEKRVFDIAKRLSYLKDLKDDFRRQGILYGQVMFQEIARRMGMRLEDISYLTEDEIMRFLESGECPAKQLVEERKKGFAIFFGSDGRITCKSGKDVEPALNELGIMVAEKFSEEIRGMPASPGVAKGKVAIVKGVYNLSGVGNGDILVAVTTHPDYVPAMQRAAAIVTDEGGITSHAAIVARELGLPCIVGTVHATKSLKNGDRVEVDAFTGVVRKIKK